jgi:hypothetical protein
MLVVQGYFAEGQFIADSPVTIPDNKKTIVTVLDEDAQKIDYLQAWKEIRKEIENSDVTNNIKHFKNIEELQVENWVG